MERARTTGSDRDAALRRVAIVLSSLPAPIASQLLSTFGPDSAARLRHAMSSLADVDPLEHRRVLQAFKGSLSQPSGSPTRSRQQPVPSMDDEISIGSESMGSGEGQGERGAGSRVVSSSTAEQSSPTSNASSLAFLGDVDDDTLMGMLRGEHPQTIALVLASIAPVQAARVLPSLDTALQGDALSRIGRLGEIPGDVVEEIAVHLRARIKQAENVNRSEAGQRALGAILAAMPQAVNHRAEPQAAAPARSTASADRHPHPTPASHRDQRDGFASAQPSGFAEADLSAVDQTHRLRLVTSLWPDETQPAAGDDPPNPQADASAPATHSAAVGADQQLPTLASTDSIHQHLLDLTAEELCEALGAVTTRQAILALCGLPHEVAQAVLSVLPRSQARQVRRGMSSLQTLELREIDEAKEAVASASMEAMGLIRSAQTNRQTSATARMAA